MKNKKITTAEEKKEEKRQFPKDVWLIYNPRKFGSKQSASINDIYAKKMVTLEANSIKGFPKVVAEYLLEKYGFITRVFPEQFESLKKEMEQKDYSCMYCDFETTDEKGLKIHTSNKHKLNNVTNEMIDGIEIENFGDAQDYVSYQDKVQVSPEQSEGIPDTSRGGRKDGDGVSWYGDGWQNETFNPNKLGEKIGSGMIRPHLPGQMPGHFSSN